MFNELDVVTVTKDFSSEKLSKGNRGTILIVYDFPNLPRAYEIEFVDDEDKTLAVITMTDDKAQEYCTLTWRFDPETKKSVKVN